MLIKIGKGRTYGRSWLRFPSETVGVQFKLKATAKNSNNKRGHRGFARSMTQKTIMKMCVHLKLYKRECIL